ncbi:amino acid permease C-terminal domain-containing protein [Aeromicrobium sp. UC242_57]|uniref:amino acid permease C-terminal domain-containing protein n=1 Tax=Aeromicrobium sp. UC242_57 TaxID=3374624 RepID=UPI00379AE5B4
MVNLSVETWIRFLIWLLIGFLVYFIYGYRSSRLGRGLTQEPAQPDATGHDA